MRDVASDEFHAEACRAFTYLIARGFLPRAYSSPTTAGVDFEGTFTVIKVALDRRDAVIDFMIRPGPKSSRYREYKRRASLNFHAFLIRERGFRGSFAPYEAKDQDLSWFARDIQMYSAALQALAPEIVAGDQDVFGRAAASGT